MWKRSAFLNTHIHIFVPYFAAFLLPAVLLTILMQAGCSVDTAPVADVVAMPESFSASGHQAVPERWWLVFEDAQLDAVVQEVLDSNLTLKSAWQRLREAQALAARESAGLYPAADGFAEGVSTQTESEDLQSFQLGLAAEYEVDLWGRIRSTVEAERYQTQARYADYQTVALSLSAETAVTWYQLQEVSSQIELVRQQITTNERILELLQARFGTGQIRTTDILRQKRLLESTREELSAAESRMGVLEHRLAILMGKPPAREAEYAYDSLPELPPLPATGIPAELVQRRPDVRTALNLLRAADQRVAAAISDQYPRLTLTAAVYTEDTDASALFDEWIRSFAGSLVGPLFDAGRREAEVRRTQAVRQQQIYDYGQAVLGAFQEVEDALVLELKQRERLLSLTEQASLAEETFERLQDEYLNGVSDYIDVLLALTNEQQLRRELISARMTLLEYRIALYRALAGGFEIVREDPL